MSAGESESRVVDARGHRCPVPSLRLRRALDSAEAGDRFLLLADDPMARIDVPHLCTQLAAEVVSVTTDADGSMTFTVVAGG